MKLDISHNNFITIGKSPYFQTLSWTDLPTCLQLRETFFCKKRQIMETNMRSSWLYLSLYPVPIQCQGHSGQLQALEQGSSQFFFLTCKNHLEFLVIRHNPYQPASSFIWICEAKAYSVWPSCHHPDGGLHHDQGLCPPCWWARGHGVGC